MGSGFTKSDEDERGNLPAKFHRFFQHEDQGQGGIVSPGSLLKEINKFKRRPTDLNSVSKVEGCSFCPYDDNLLLTVVGYPNDATAGYVQMWDLEGEDEDNFAKPIPVSSNFFTYSPLPACQFSSNGDLVSAILNNGVGRLTVLAMTGEDELTPCNVLCEGNNLLRGRVKCCVFSQDNRKAVTICNVALSTFSHSSINEICIWRITSQRSMKSVWRASCEVLCPEFSGNVHSCVLSPNGDYLAISSFFGQAVVLDCTIFDTVGHKSCKCFGKPDGPLMCLFNPRFACKLLFCHSNTWCCTQDFEVSLHDRSITSCIVEDDSVTANACTFSPDGEHFALALSNAIVVICDADSLEMVFEIKPSFSPLSELGAFSLAISRSCQELAVGYNDGYVCVWQLPPKLDLRHICRLLILKFIPAKKIPLLPLPEKLKSYLLYSFQRQFKYDE